MKIPKKISPDRIKDAVIELKYFSKVPFEVALGMFYQVLDETYIYTNRPLKQQATTSFPGKFPKEITLTLGGQPLFYNKLIKIQIQPNSIIFNCLDKYISWDLYKPEIEKVLTEFFKANVIEKFSRIGMRYISEYPDMDIKDCVNFSFTFGMPDIKSDTYSFHSEFLFDKFTIALNLSNKLPVININEARQQTSVSSMTIIDIDVIEDDLNISELPILLEHLEEVHHKEKHVFFSLLKESFLQTLNPEY